MPISIKMMKLLTLFFIFFFSNHAVSKDTQLKKFYAPKWKMTDRSIEYLLDGEILSDATVDSEDKTQEFQMKVAAVHPKPCRKILRKLSMYEKFEQWISFIRSSKYDDKNRLWTIRANHTLLPYPMIVHIIVDRPTKPGKYPFVFPTGMFTGLSGHFIVKKHKNRCAFFATSYWKGTDTKLPNFVIELFSETLTKLGGEIVFRKIK